MGNVGREKMSEHVQLYFHQRNLSQALSNTLEHNGHAHHPFKSTKMAIKTDPLLKRKVRPAVTMSKCALNNGASRRIDVGLPIDLSKRGGQAEIDNLHCLELHSSDDESDNRVANEGMEEEEEFVSSDEPLNLSTNGAKNGEKREKAKDLQKRLRLEEMVSYIRKCSVVDEIKYRTSGSSENGDERSINPTLDNSQKHDESTSEHRRIPYQHSVLRAGGNGDALRASYPVLRQQLLRSVSKDVPETDDGSVSEAESDVDEEIMAIQRRSTNLNMNENSSSDDMPIVPHPHWSTYAYYATMAAAAAKGLLMTTTTTNKEAADVEKGSNESPQQPQMESNNGGTLLRKRAPRALTGKHVKHGTGASPATLLTLRQKIEQKMSQQQPEAKMTKSNGSNGKRGVAVKRNSKRKISV